MTKFMKSFLAFAVPGIFLISSCKKDLEVKPNTKTGDSTQYYTSIDNDVNSVDEAIDEAQEDNSNQRKGGDCYTVTFSADTISPVPGYEINFRKFVLTFTGTCDSLNRTGQITVYKSGSWLTGNYKDSAVFSGYSTDGRSISGYRTRALSKSSDLKNLVFTFSNNLTINTGSGIISHVSNGKKTIVNYLIPLMKYVTISGQGLYVHADGSKVSYNITKPIVLNGACARKYRFPVEGTIAYANTGTSYSSIVDFGSGTCDKIATISVNGGAAVTFKMK